MLALALVTGGKAEMDSLKILRIGTRDNADSMTEIFAFAGSMLSIRLDYTAAAGTRITWTHELFLTSSSMAVPFEKFSPLTRVAGEEDTHVLWLPDVRAPEVKQRTEMLLKILGQTEGNESTCANIRLFVFPLDMAKPLKELVSGGIRLAVFGKSNAIRTFLRVNRIAFTELGDEIPRQVDRGLFVAGDIDSRKLDDWLKHLPKGAFIRLVAFTRDPWSIPGAYVQAQSGSVICKVTLPILENLASDPRSQAAFVELFSQSISAFTPSAQTL